MIIDKLQEASKNSPVCLGLDTRYDYLPESIKSLEDLSKGEKIAKFNKEVIDATKDLVACYKVQIACYEALGLDGLKAYSDTVKYARDNGVIVIGDVKRGDIASTAEEYAKGHFEGDFEVDFMTLNPYMGVDAISPYFKYLEDKDKGVFILLHTSNKSATDFEELALEDGNLVFEAVADKIDEWGKPFIGDSGFSSIASVVGLTYPEAFEQLVEAHPNQFFLVPGYGAQGGTGEDIAKILKKSRCAVVNNSRGLLTAHKGKTEGDDYTDYIRKATIDMKEDIFQWL